MITKSCNITIGHYHTALLTDYNIAPHVLVSDKVMSESYLQHSNHQLKLWIINSARKLSADLLSMRLLSLALPCIGYIEIHNVMVFFLRYCTLNLFHPSSLPKPLLPNFHPCPRDHDALQLELPSNCIATSVRLDIVHTKWRALKTSQVWLVILYICIRVYNIYNIEATLINLLK